MKVHVLDSNVLKGLVKSLVPRLDVVVPTSNPSRCGREAEASMPLREFEVSLVYKTSSGCPGRHNETLYQRERELTHSRHFCKSLHREREEGGGGGGGGGGEREGGRVLGVLMHSCNLNT